MTRATFGPMKAIGVNGSPRKRWNTAAVLDKALEGAASAGATTELVHLYDLTYHGCRSCFACKTRGGPSYGRCGARDELTPLLERVLEADVILLASPIYFGTATAEMRAFQERLLFPLITYTDPPASLFTRRVRIGSLYTMNATETQARQLGYDGHVQTNERYLKRILGAAESLCIFDTCQFEDYAKVEASRFDAAAKARRRAEALPLDCERAFQLGARLVRELG
jgi:multimeric flavodoxin WrbA